jgi:hypothetical protein
MTFVASLAFTLFVGAARYDATPEQVSMLKAQIIPLLVAYKENGDETAVREAVHRIMGPQWKPNVDFRRQIVELQNASLAASTARLRAAGFATGARPRVEPPRSTLAALRPGLPAPTGTGPVGGASDHGMEGGLTHAPGTEE